MYAKQFGITKSDGQLQTFLFNDWIHSIFYNQHAPSDYKLKAKIILFAEIKSSLVAFFYFSGSDVSFDQNSIFYIFCFIIEASIRNHQYHRYDLFDHESEQRHQKLERFGFGYFVVICK